MTERTFFSIAVRLFGVSNILQSIRSLDFPLTLPHFDGGLLYSVSAFLVPAAIGLFLCLRASWVAGGLIPIEGSAYEVPDLAANEVLLLTVGLRLVILIQFPAASWNWLAEGGAEFARFWFDPARASASALFRAAHGEWVIMLVLLASLLVAPWLARLIVATGGSAISRRAGANAH
jgi:hypothetical protein